MITSSFSPPQWTQGSQLQDRLDRWVGGTLTGNLTLTGFNSELEARPFTEKKNHPVWGYVNSPVWLSKGIAAQQVWGPDQIEQRGSQLAARAIALWRPLVADTNMMAQLDLDDAKERSAGSSHAPLVCVVSRASGGGYAAGLSMANVAQALMADSHGFPGWVVCGPTEVGTAAYAEMPALAGWFACPDLHVLEGLLARAWALSRALPNELERRFQRALAAVQATERDATVRQRVGQNLFREGLMALWGGRCAVTGLDMPALLRASHAKPWADSSDAERMDVYNGLLLAAHWDAAFDAGLVSFDADGRPLWSPKLSYAGVELLRQGSRVDVQLVPRHMAYMAWHRDRVWQSKG